MRGIVIGDIKNIQTGITSLQTGNKRQGQGQDNIKDSKTYGEGWEVHGKDQGVYGEGQEYYGEGQEYYGEDQECYKVYCCLP